MPISIAMWSGPRNVSTALMRAFSSRADTVVCDEPLYAHYLLATGLPHPGRESTLAHHDSDWRRVTAWLTGPVPEGKSVWYQKHMAHHLLPGIGRDWLDRLTHAFLIREPSAMLASLTEFLPSPTLADTGLPQQWELFQRVADRLGRPPPVIDGRDLQTLPETMLARLCAALRIAFDPAMLAWPAGIHRHDGAWAPLWYGKVAASTGFSPPREATATLPEALRPLEAPCMRIYERLHAHRLTV